MHDHRANPAGRLWGFLNFMIERRGSQMQVLNACAVYLDIEPALTRELYEGVGALVALPGEIEHQVAFYDGHLPKEYLLRPLPQARNALGQLSTLHNTTEVFCAHYSDATLTGLEACSFALSSLNREVPVDADTLSEVRDLAQSILDMLAGDGTLDEQVKSIIFDHAEAILSASNKVRVRGAVALLEERDRAIGALLTTGMFEQVKKTAAGQRLFELLSRIALVATLFGTPVAIAADTHDILAMTIGPTVVSNQASNLPGK